MRVARLYQKYLKRHTSFASFNDDLMYLALLGNRWMKFRRDPFLVKGQSLIKIQSCNSIIRGLDYKFHDFDEHTTYRIFASFAQEKTLTRRETWWYHHIFLLRHWKVHGDDSGSYTFCKPSCAVFAFPLRWHCLWKSFYYTNALNDFPFFGSFGI